MTAQPQRTWILEVRARRNDQPRPIADRDAGDSGNAAGNAAGTEAPATPGLAGDQRRNARSMDGTTVRWNGIVYELSPRQRDVITILWESYANGVPSVSGEALAEATECGKIASLFRGSPAWGNLIAPSHHHGGRYGAFRLVPSDLPLSLAS